MKLTKRDYGLAAILIALFSTPIIVYILQFGFGLWGNHQKWAELGSFLSGVYTPIFSLLTLYVLFNQFKLMKKSQKFQEDMIFISGSELEIDSYIQELLNKPELLELALKNFYSLSNKEILELISSTETCNALKAQPFYKLAPIWHAANGCLLSLDFKGYPYKHHLHQLIFRIQRKLSHPKCVALDKMLFCLSNPENQPRKLYYSEMGKNN